MNGAAVFCESLQGKTMHVLLGCRAAGPNVGCWVLPGGHANPGESMADAADREFLEETGLRCLLLPIGRSPFGSPDPQPEHHEHMPDGRIVFFFRATRSFHEPGRARDSEFSEIRWVTAAEAHALKLTPTVRKVLRVMWPEFEALP